MDRDLQDLLAIWRSDQDPGEVRRDELLTRLRNDADFRKQFVAELHLLGLLRAVQSAEPRWLQLEDEIGWSAKQPADVEALVQSVVSEGKRRLRVTRWRRWAGALAVCVLGAVGVALALRRGPEPVDEQPARPAMELATILKSEGVRWDASGQGPFADGDVVPAGRLCIDAGRLTLGFYGGVSLTAEGPADLELIAANRVFFHHGKVRVQVPKGAEGFTVLAAGYEVVDLGTEFALTAEPGGKPKIMVFDGEAAVSVLGQNGRSVRSTVVEGDRSVEVHTGAGAIEEVTPHRESFAELGKFVPGPLELAPEYGAVVRAAQPWGYWRFETLRDDLIANEIPGGPALRSRGRVAIERSTSGNHCARFVAGDTTQSFILDGMWTPPRSAGYAIEIWAQADLPSSTSNSQTALVSVVDQLDVPGEKHLAYLELAARGRRWPHEPCSIRFLDRWPPDRRGGTDVFSRRTVVPCFWRHIVGQKTPEGVELFVDGELVATTPNKQPAVSNQSDAVTKACRILVGRLKLHPLSDKASENRDFVGRVDELAVYNRQLTLDEIRQHSRLRLGSP